MATTGTFHQDFAYQDATDHLKKAKTLTTIIYALYAATFLVGVSWFVAGIMNYLKKEEVAGTFLESHFRWQMRTFWFGSLWGLVGMVTLLIVVGWFVLMANAVWIIYRLVQGWLRLNDNKPMYVK
jgi:uncharacterized membrane protein